MKGYLVTFYLGGPIAVGTHRRPAAGLGSLEGEDERGQRGARLRAPARGLRVLHGRAARHRALAELPHLPNDGIL